MSIWWLWWIMFFAPFFWILVFAVVDRWQSRRAWRAADRDARASMDRDYPGWDAKS